MAVEFLEKLRPSGPWVLTAIKPDGPIETITANGADDVRGFVERNNGVRNLYFSVNPTRTTMFSKAAKVDISAIAFVLSDLDPRADETPEAAKARYFTALESFTPAPTAIIDSGNGLQALWRLAQPIELPEPDVVENDKGELERIYSPETQAVIDDAEGRVKALMETLNSAAGTQNIDRIFRLPGTINLPNAKKIKDGRTQCEAKLLKFDDSTCLLDNFPPATVETSVSKAKPSNDNASNNSSITSLSGKIDWAKVDQNAGWLKGVSDLPGHDGIRPFNIKGQIIVAHSGNLGDLEFDLKQSGQVLHKPYKSWSEVSIALTAILKADGRLTIEQIAAALMCPLTCNQHITGQPDDAKKRRAVERAIERSHEPTDQQKVQRTAGDLEWREKRANGTPIPSMYNARLAITDLGVVCRLDLFHKKTLFGYRDDTIKHELTSVLGEVSDYGIIALRQLMSNRFGFDLEDKATRDAVKSLALENCFDPVCDMIDKAEAEWDGVERLDRMAVDYFNCADTPINRAFMRKTMIALVKRAREPGCKFDTITVLESPEGFSKSTAWRVLAGDENYSDESIIGKASREVQEQLSEVWLHENADLAGMKKTDIESVKAYASRATDIARPAFGHFVVRQPRRSIETGTTNSDEYLQSQTGNRRFWPLRILRAIDIEKLRRDRLQLIGEAAKYHNAGESVVLDEALWADAGIEQEQRRVKDPWEDILANIPVWHKEIRGFDENKVPVEHLVLIVHIDGLSETVAAADLMKYLLDIQVAHQTSAIGMRLSTVMKRLGWSRNSNGSVTINGVRQKGYFRPAENRKEEVRQVKLRQDEARQAEFQAEIHEASLNSAPPSEHM
jgi:predicted P-loop ATPase